MNTSTNPKPPAIVNHHADYPGFAGPVGLAAGLVMLLAGGRRARMVVDLASVKPDDTIVDIGCGPGGAAGVAARRGARVVGVDPAPAMLRLARTFVHGRSLSWAIGTAENLPVPDGAATVAWAVATVHHWPEVTAALAETRRALAPGGRFLTVERAVNAGASGLADHGWTEVQAQSFADRCRAAQFADVRIDRPTAGRRTFWAVHAVRP